MHLSSVFAMLFLVAAGSAASERPSLGRRDSDRYLRRCAQSPSAAGSVLPPLTGEFLVDTSIAIFAAGGSQAHPSVALGDTNFLVVWHDGRGASADVYGARVSPQGVVLDRTGIPVSTATDDQLWPAVAFDGENFLVVWMSGPSGCYDVHCARVSQAGALLDPTSIPVSIAPNDQWCPRVAFDGERYLVAWSDGRSGHEFDIYGARVTPDVQVLEPDGFVISAAEGGQEGPAVAFDGTSFLVAWTDRRGGGTSDVYGARVSSDGSVLDPDGFVISSEAMDQWAPAVASGGAGSLVVWHDYRSGGYDIYGARVTPQGTTLDPNGIIISADADDEYFPAPAFDGANYLVVWQNGFGLDSDIFGARVTPQGVVLDTGGLSLSNVEGDDMYPAVGFDNASFLVAWTGWREGVLDFDVVGTRVTPQGRVLDSAAVPLSTSAHCQCAPAAAAGSANHLAVWQDLRRDRCGDVYGARLSRVGVVLDPCGISISAPASSQWGPAAAYGGGRYLATWPDTRVGPVAIYGSRVMDNGQVLDTGCIRVSRGWDNKWHPSAAFDGENFLVVWSTSSSGTEGDIYGARVTPQGSVLDSGIPISIEAGEQWSPAVAFGGEDFLVVWRDRRSGNDDIYGARVSPEGTVLERQGVAISTATDGQWEPAIAYGGGRFLVVWEDFRGGLADIYGCRVTPQGTVLEPDGIAISTAPGAQFCPAAAFNATDFLVVWQDWRGDHDIYGARVRADGSVFGEGAVVTQVGDQECPALCRGPDGQMLLVYQGWAGTVGGKTYNTDRIWGKMNPVPGVVETMNDERGTMNARATIVRGVMRLPVSPFTIHSSLFDMTGRRVMALQPGPNDVSRLAPGVYFVRTGSGIRKVQIAR